MAANKTYTTSGKADMSEFLDELGYAYDSNQNIFYTVMHPWQRELGYCSLYDEASQVLGMVIDCEPIYFDYAGKHWLIELWKGQYGITSGAEIGVYNTEGPLLDVPGVFNGTVYMAASDEETLSMTYTLIKKNKVLFNRAAQHWWLTGFVLGEYTDPSELSMEASITFRDEGMRRAFEEGLLRAGYSSKEYRASGRTLLVLYRQPHSKQPFTRQEKISGPMLAQLKKNVEVFRDLTKGMTELSDILQTLKTHESLLFPKAAHFGKSTEVFKLFEEAPRMPELQEVTKLFEEARTEPGLQEAAKLFAEAQQPQPQEQEQGLEQLLDTLFPAQ
jgi:hypothetical protein